LEEFLRHFVSAAIRVGCGGVSDARLTATVSLY